MYIMVFKYMMDAQSEAFSLRLGWRDGPGTDASGAMSRFLVSVRRGCAEGRTTHDASQCRRASAVACRNPQ
jgi:hypothetical protein